MSVRSGVETGILFGTENIIEELDTNNEFTQYVTNNFVRLVKDCEAMLRKAGSHSLDMAHDVVMDVYMSYMLNESNGEGYDMTKSRTGELISVEHSVYGRIKSYCMNKKYHGYGCSNKVVEVPASSNGERLEDKNMYQKAYDNAESYNDIEDVNQAESLAEELAFVISLENDFVKKSGVSVKTILQNISTLTANIDNIDTDVFSSLRFASEEFKDALKSIISIAGKNAPLFNRVLVEVLSE